MKLTVAKAYPSDAGRGIARLDPHILMVLQLMPGDIIEIEGLKSTAAKVWCADRKDLKENIIRIDGFIRQNAGVSISRRSCSLCSRGQHQPLEIAGIHANTDRNSSCNF